MTDEHEHRSTRRKKSPSATRPDGEPQPEHLLQPHHGRSARGLPQNVKPLSATLERAFVVTMQNQTNQDRTFTLTLTAQSGVWASFLQAPADQPLSDALPDADAHGERFPRTRERPGPSSPSRPTRPGA